MFIHDLIVLQIGENKDQAVLLQFRGSDFRFAF